VIEIYYDEGGAFQLVVALGARGRDKTERSAVIQHPQHLAVLLESYDELLAGNRILPDSNINLSGVCMS
jgi:hypothetical protein